MNLYIKQHVFTWRDKFSVYDASGAERYFVESELFTFGKRLHVYDTRGAEVAYIEQKVFSFLPKYYIFRGEREVAQIVREFTFFKHEYTVSGLGWRVHGDWFDHEYEVERGGTTVAAVSKEWFTFGDAYEIRINDEVDEINALAVCLVIDACIESDRNN